MAEQKVSELEQAGWSVLSSSSERATAFYEHILDDAVVFLLPGGLVLNDRASIVKSMSGPPWTSFELSDMHEFSPTDDTAVVRYRVAARRGEEYYSALIGSMYVHREIGWKLTYHQQTPT